MQILSNTYNLVQLIVLLIHFTPLDIAFSSAGRDMWHIEFFYCYFLEAYNTTITLLQNQEKNMKTLDIEIFGFSDRI